MITINLLPEEYKSKKRATTLKPYLPLAFLLGIIFLLLTLFFYVDYLKTLKAYGLVRKEWEQLSPQMKQLKALESRVEIEMQAEKDFLEKNVLNTESTARILQWVSEYLPPRGWLTELKFEREGEGGRLLLQGAVFSMGSQTAIEQIEVYMRNLKEKLPSGEFTLTTAKQDDKKSEGMAFTATFDWGVKKA